jgi:ketosteroid isomerase-like protein
MASSSRATRTVNRVVNVGTVRTFLRLLEEKDIDSWIKLWADDADHYYPFGTRMFPGHLVGTSAIYDRWKGLPAVFDSLSFPVRETWADGDTVIARFDGDCVLTNGGGHYQNTYVSIFNFDGEGRIREYWEYFDPILAGVNFGLAEVRYLEAPERDPELSTIVDLPLVRWNPRSGTLDIFDRQIATEIATEISKGIAAGPQGR